MDAISRCVWVIVHTSFVSGWLVDNSTCGRLMLATCAGPIVVYPKAAIALFMRFATSSLPRKAASSYMSGPCPVPTRATRHAFHGLMPVCSAHGSMTAFMPSTVQADTSLRRESICLISSAVPSFQFFRTNLSPSLS